jgi:hypothetical protein
VAFRWVQERTFESDGFSGFGLVNLSVGVMFLAKYGYFGLTGEETSMGKEAQKSVVLSDEAQKKFEECVAALTAMRYPDGPPRDTTFAEIEEFGHEVGRMLGRAVDQQLTAEHSSHFTGANMCPTCQSNCEPKSDAVLRELQTCDGQVPIEEPVCRCSVCNRDFFPSACRVDD